MAKGFKHGAGGGASLNFKVVGGTAEPASPKENTIWVNTDVEITSWVFSATEPENPSEGMVWISTDKVAAAEFNALKKNSIQVYPTSACQYVSGAWAGVTAKSYQDGIWKEWIVELYNYGDECVDVTGGWKDVSGCTHSKLYSSGVYSKTATFNSDHIVINFNKSNPLSIYMAATKNKVDLTPFKVIRFTVEYTGGDGMVVSVNSIKDSYDTNYVAKMETDEATFAYNETRTLELDISSLTGAYYILAYALPNTDSGRQPSWKLKYVSLG